MSNRVPINSAEQSYPSFFIKHEVCGKERIIVNYDKVFEYNRKYNDLSGFNLNVYDSFKPVSPVYSQIHRIFDRYSYAEGQNSGV